MYTAFERAFSNTATADTIVFKRRTDAGLGANDLWKEALYNALQKERPVAIADLRHFWRTFDFRMDAIGQCWVTKIEVFREWAEACITLPVRFLTFVTGVHMKAFYEVPLSGPDIREDLVRYEGGQQASIFSKAQKPGGVKGDGRGWRIGQRKSDMCSVGYKRRGQRDGLEVRVSGAALSRMRQELLASFDAARLRDSAAWAILFSNVALAGAERLRRNLEKKGLSPFDYFELFIDQPTFGETLLTGFTVEGEPIQWEMGPGWRTIDVRDGVYRPYARKHKTVKLEGN